MRSVIIVDTGPAWWLVVLPALTGLLGAGLVAWWQGRQGKDRWRRDARLRAYSELLSRHHAFEHALEQFAGGDAWSDDLERERMIQLVERTNEVAASISMIEIVGPPKLLESAGQLGLDVEAALNNSTEMRDQARALLEAIRRGDDPLPTIGAAEYFGPLRENRRKFTAAATELFKTAE